MDVIAKLNAERPLFHGGADNPQTWGSGFDVLRFIRDNVTPDMATLETGCGYSTVTFASVGNDHTTVMFDENEIVGVRNFCDVNLISLDNVKFRCGPSVDVLLTLDQTPLDLVYIDGAHGFPHPCIDWYHTEKRLRIGGRMLIDDVRIPTCRILHDFLMQETRCWKFERYLGDTSVFRKIAVTPNSSDWAPQRSNRAYPDYSFFPPHLRAFYNAQKVAKKIGLAPLLNRLFRRT